MVFHFCWFDHIIFIIPFSVYLATFSYKFALCLLLHFLLSSFLSFCTSKSDFPKSMSALIGPMFLPCIPSAPNLPTPISLSLHSVYCKVTSSFLLQEVDGSPSSRSCSTPVTSLSSLQQSLPLASSFSYSSAFSCFSGLSLIPLGQLMYSLSVLEFLNAQVQSLICLYSLLLSWMVICTPIAYHI